MYIVRTTIVKRDNVVFCPNIFVSAIGSRRDFTPCFSAAGTAIKLSKFFKPLALGVISTVQYFASGICRCSLLATGATIAVNFTSACRRPRPKIAAATFLACQTCGHLNSNCPCVVAQNPSLRIFGRGDLAPTLHQESKSQRKRWGTHNNLIILFCLSANRLTMPHSRGLGSWCRGRGW